MVWAYSNSVGVLLVYLFGFLFFDCFRLFEGLLSGNSVISQKPVTNNKDLIRNLTVTFFTCHECLK